MTMKGVWFYSEAIPPYGVTGYRTLVLTASDVSQLGVGDGTTDAVAALSVLPGEPTGSVQEKGPFTVVGGDPRLDPHRAKIVPTTFTTIDEKLALEQLPADFRFGPTAEDVAAVHPPR